MSKQENASSAEPVQYMSRTRAYYRALGYQQDYVWATQPEVAFAPVTKAASELTLALVTTANPLDWIEGQPKQVWSGSTAAPPQALNTSDLAWDKDNTHTDDVESFLPIKAAQRLVDAGGLGALTSRYYGLPSEYSQAKTQQQDVPQLLPMLREDGADAVLLIPL